MLVTQMENVKANMVLSLEERAFVWRSKTVCDAMQGSL